ncbi:MAG: hypothetical protein A2X01_17825 [Bacteroidetes bacterium GWF2_35_48]|nr:MAG: hypothetical protein A2X01_17825 [Bacteroidetes bacterium GWF2_35_48]
MKSLLILNFISFFSFFCKAQEWHSVYPYLNSNGGPVTIFCLHTYNNELFVGGGFIKAGSIPTKCIAKWDSVNWYALGTGVTFGGGGVKSIAVYNSLVYIGGEFSGINGNLTPNYFASWNGSELDSVSTNGEVNGQVYSLKVFNNKLFIGGRFPSVGGIICGNIAQWDGSTIADVGGGVSGGIMYVKAMAVYNNELYVGGNFYSAGGLPAYYIARWDGVQWRDVGGGVNAQIYTMIVDTIENALYIGGSFFNVGGGTINARAIAKWNGNTWSNIGTGFNFEVFALGMYRGKLFAGGYYTTSGDSLQHFNHIAVWDGIKWDSLSNGVNGNVFAFEVYKDELYIGGDFTLAGGDSAYGLAKWYIHPDSVNVTTELQASTKEQQLKIYPNPTNGNITVEFTLPEKQKALLKIYNSKGELFRKFIVAENENQKNIDTSKWAKGVYYCVLEQKDKRFSQVKFIVE